MAESLALKYRPHSFDDLVGQRAVNVILRAMVTQSRVHTALLFQGSHGTGKTTTARILAAALNCDTPPQPCGTCPSCKAVFDGTSMDLDERDAASNGLVEDIRALCQQVMYSVSGHYRVVVLDEAHSMSTAAFNALLKTLEEPQPATVFVLATTEPGRIPDTVLSRCMPFTFTRISVADMTARLTYIAAQEHLSTEPGLLALLAERADGAMRDAVMALDMTARAGITTVADYIALTGESDCGPALLRTILAGDLAATFATVAEVLTRTGNATAVSGALTAALRDLLILRAGGTLTHQGQALSERTALAQEIDTPTLFAAMTVLWDLKTKARLTEDPRTTLDLAVAMLTDKIAKPAPPSATPSTRKLSLAEMAAITA